MNHYFRRVLLLGFGLLFVLAGPAQSVFAQSAGEGISVQPAVTEDNVTSGEGYHFNLTFTNVGTTDKTFYLAARDIKGLDDSGQPIFAAAGEATGYELSTWIELPTTPITLKAGQSTTLALTAHVPSDVSPGAHFGGVFITDQSPRLSANGSAISVSVGSIMSLTVAGNLQEEASLQEFSTDKVVYSSPVVNFNTKIQNSGNVLLRPHGVIQITDMLGHQVANIDVNDSAAPVFPASERVYTVLWQPTGFAFGRYEAVGSFSYGDTEKKTISGTTSFWVLPLGPIALFLGSILGIVILMYALIRTYIRGKLRQIAGQNDGRADVDFYAKKYQRSGSRLAVITLLVFLFCVVFLGILFLIFA